MLCCAALRNALLRYTLIRCVALFRAGLRDGVPSYAMRCYAVLRFSVRRWGVLGNVFLVALCFAVSWTCSALLAY